MCEEKTAVKTIMDEWAKMIIGGNAMYKIDFSVRQFMSPNQNKGFLVNTRDGLKKYLEKFNDCPIRVYITNSEQYYIELPECEEITEWVDTEVFFTNRMSENAFRFIKDNNIEVRDRVLYLMDRSDDKNHKLVPLEMKNRVFDSTEEEFENSYKSIKIDVKYDILNKHEINELRWNMFYEKYLKRIDEKKLKKIKQQEFINKYGKK
jgi:hypothetical protein